MTGNRIVEVAPEVATSRGALPSHVPDVSTLSGFLQRHRVAIYFGLTFAFSWGGVLLIIAGREGVAGTNTQTDPMMYLAMLVGPPVSGLLMTGLVSGRAGFAALVARLLRWKVGIGWYALALLMEPVLAAASLFALLPISAVFLPGIMASSDKPGLLDRHARHTRFVRWAHRPADATARRKSADAVDGVQGADQYLRNDGLDCSPGDLPLARWAARIGPPGHQPIASSSRRTKP